MPDRFKSHNQSIKRRLIWVPIMMITMVAVVVALLSGWIMQSTDIGLWWKMGGMVLGVVALFSFITVLLVRKNFIARLDKLEKGLFHFLDYLALKRSDPGRIEEGVGSMSDAINKRIDIISANKAQNQQFLQVLKEVMKQVEKGDFQKRIEVETKDALLQEIKTQINTMIQALQEKVGKDLPQILSVLDHYSKEDYTQSIANPQGEIEQAIMRLREAVVEMLQASLLMGTEFQQAASRVNQKVQKAYETIDVDIVRELATVIYAIDEITAHIKANVESASFIRSYSDGVAEAAHEGEILAKETAKAMSEIDEEVNKINEAISVIDKITMQTNILSLNAAVEASSAGESGKGFAVVAQEVRNLASQTSIASKEIQSVVDIAKEKVQVGNEVLTKMINGYRQLVDQVSNSTDLIQNIVTHSNLQDVQIQKINDLVKHMQELITLSLGELKEAEQFSSQNRDRARELVAFSKEKKFIDSNV